MNFAKIRFRKKSVILTWLLSYLVVLILPIAMNVAVYDQTERTLKNQIKRGNDSLLFQMQESVDSEIASVRQLVSQIYANVKVQNLFYSNKLNRGDYRYDLYEIIHDLGSLRSAYTSFEEFYIYWAPGDRVIMPTLYKASEEAYEDLYAGGSLSREEWKRRVSGINQRQFILTSRRTDEGKMRYYATYISSFPVGSNDQPVGSIAVMLNNDQLLRTISSIPLFNSGDVFIMNERNEVMVSNVPDEKDLSALGPFPDSHGEKSVAYRGKPSTVYYVKSHNSELTYATIVPDQIVWKESQYVRNLTYFSIVISLVGGALLTWLFLRRNYLPLSQLIQTFSRRIGGLSAKEVNEFSYLEQMLAKTLDEKEQASLRVKQQTHQLGGNFIARLMKGRIQASIPDEEALKAFQLDFETDDFCVLLLYLEESQPFYERIGSLQVEDPAKLLDFVVTNVVEETLNRSQRGYMAEVGDMMACLINLRAGDEERSLRDIGDAAREARDFLLQQYQIGITTAVSGVHSTLTSIPEAYKESLDVMEYKWVMGREGHLSYPEMRTEQGNPTQYGYYYPLQVEQQLMTVVKSGNIDAARQLLNEIIDRNLSQPAMAGEQIRCLLFDLTGTLMKTIQELGETNVDFQSVVHRSFDRLSDLKTIKEINQEMLAMLERVCAYTADRQSEITRKWKNAEQDGFIRSIVRYIEDHYQDVNLNITMIGEAFDMKPTYLSKLFKDHTGEGLLDKISQTRIERAKILLREERMVLQEVMEQCGFNDLNTFSRSFKKWVGVTPGQYRKME
ncbi:AraC family transcriptional regulator [Paenibacillus xanthanilyticus]|uniref:AraC family transcriptional regulator n=1 Tax=Paenibacillus xanthanilyticus TaxID=1783531 RepID=A0ABV8KBM9_9BACL